MLDFDVVHWAALHCGEVVGLVDKAPVNHEFKFGFEDMVEPNPPAAPVSLAERVGNIHLNVFFDYLVKGGLRHCVNAVKRGFQVLRRGKTEKSLSNVFRAYLPGKGVYFPEQKTVYLRKRCEYSRGFIVKKACFKQLQRLFLADFFLGFFEFCGSRNSKLIRQTAHFYHHPFSLLYTKSNGFVKQKCACESQQCDMMSHCLRAVFMHLSVWQE